MEENKWWERVNDLFKNINGISKLRRKKEYNALSTLLSDVYSIIGNNSKLIKALLKIRLICNAINNETNLLFGKMSVPIGSRAPLIKDHNDFLRKQIDRISPIIDSCLVILEKSYGIKNPLDDNST